MTTAALDRRLARLARSRSYKALAREFPPRPINDSALAKITSIIIESLMSIPNPSPDQLEYLELQSSLVEEYESARHPTPTTSLSSLLSHLIEAKGVTQTTVAKEVGIAASTVSDVLAGRRSLSLANIRRFADYFSVDPGLFVSCTG